MGYSAYLVRDPRGRYGATCDCPAVWRFRTEEARLAVMREHVCTSPPPLDAATLATLLEAFGGPGLFSSS